MPEPLTAHQLDGCGSCSLSPRVANRRDFLHRAGRLAAALVLAPVVAQAGQGDPPAPPILPRAPDDGVSERRYAIPGGDSIQVDRDNSLMIARASDRVFAFSLSCPHQNTALRWEAGDREFRCPKHQTRYLPDGTFIDGRATRPIDRLAIRRDGDTLVVDVDVVYQQDEQLNQWSSAFIAL